MSDPRAKREAVKKSATYRIANKTLAYLLSQGWTMRSLTEYLGLHPASLPNLRYGYAMPRVETIDKLLEVAGFEYRIVQTRQPLRPQDVLPKKPHPATSKRKKKELELIRQDSQIQLLQEQLS